MSEDPIAWISFDGRMALHGKEKDPTVEWYPLQYMTAKQAGIDELSTQLNAMTTQNRFLRGALANMELQLRRPLMAFPIWQNEIAPPLSKPLIGLWWDDIARKVQDPDSYELLPCKIEWDEEAKTLIWTTPQGIPFTPAPDLWILAPETIPTLEEEEDPPPF